MDPNQRCALEKCTVELVNDMNLQAMQAMLFTKKILTPNEYERRGKRERWSLI